MSLNAVPIVDVHLDNFRQLWPSILLAIKTSSFIAIDLELSGLGNRKALNASSVEERYLAISRAAKSRSIISIGLSCFKLLDENTETTKSSTHQMWDYYVQTFNITSLCSQDFIVEPEALKFLVGHGFDFNKQYSQGVPYYKGNDKEENILEPCIRSLFSEILKANRSLVLHNGLVDLIFMYQCWYAELPSTMASFAADFFEACPGGIYDTKYIAEYFARTTATYLEYVFRKLQRENEVKATAKRPHVSISFMQFRPDMPFVEYRQLSVDTTGHNTVPPSDICMTYAYHGWCPKADTCPLSHNVDCVLDMEGGKMNRKKKRKIPQMQMFGNYPLSKKVKVSIVKEELKCSKNVKKQDDVGPLITSRESLASRSNDSDQDEPLVQLDDALPPILTTDAENCAQSSTAIEGSKSLLLPVNSKGQDLPVKLTNSDINTDNGNQQDTVETSPTQQLVECTSSAVIINKEKYVSNLQESSVMISGKQQVCMLVSSESPNTVLLKHHESQTTILATEDRQKAVLVDLCSDKRLPEEDDNTKHSIMGNERVNNKEAPNIKMNVGNLTQESQQADILSWPTQMPANNGMVTSTQSEDAEECLKSLTNICSNKNESNALDIKSNTCGTPSDKKTENVSRLGQKSRGHRAGCDAFMTGFTMAVFLARYGVKPSKASLFSPENTRTDEMVNKMYLSGKSVPFLIWKSQYTKTSKQHQEKLLKLHSN